MVEEKKQKDQYPVRTELTIENGSVEHEAPKFRDSRSRSSLGLKVGANYFPDQNLSIGKINVPKTMRIVEISNCGQECCLDELNIKGIPDKKPPKKEKRKKRREHKRNSDELSKSDSKELKDAATSCTSLVMSQPTAEQFSKLAESISNLSDDKKTILDCLEKVECILHYLEPKDTLNFFTSSKADFQRKEIKKSKTKVKEEGAGKGDSLHPKTDPKSEEQIPIDACTSGSVRKKRIPRSSKECEEFTEAANSILKYGPATCNLKRKSSVKHCISKNSQNAADGKEQSLSKDKRELNCASERSAFRQVRTIAEGDIAPKSRVSKTLEAIHVLGSMMAPHSSGEHATPSAKPKQKSYYEEYNKTKETRKQSLSQPSKESVTVKRKPLISKERVEMLINERPYVETHKVVKPKRESSDSRTDEFDRQMFLKFSETRSRHQSFDDAMASQDRKYKKSLKERKLSLDASLKTKEMMIFQKKRTNEFQRMLQNSSISSSWKLNPKQEEEEVLSRQREHGLKKTPEAVKLNPKEEEAINRQTENELRKTAQAMMRNQLNRVESLRVDVEKPSTSHQVRRQHDLKSPNTASKIIEATSHQLRRQYDANAANTVNRVIDIVKKQKTLSTTQTRNSLTLPRERRDTTTPKLSRKTTHEDAKEDLTNKANLKTDPEIQKSLMEWFTNLNTYFNQGAQKIAKDQVKPPTSSDAKKSMCPAKQTTTEEASSNMKQSNDQKANICANSTSNDMNPCKEEKMTKKTIKSSTSVKTKEQDQSKPSKSCSVPLEEIFRNRNMRNDSSSDDS